MSERLTPTPDFRAGAHVNPPPPLPARSHTTGSTPCSSFSEFMNHVMAKDREYAFCLTVHKTEALSSEVVGAPLAGDLKSTSRLRRAAVRVEAIYED